MGYKAIYPAETIEAHRAFIARRRATRPSEEYRTPTDEEWDAFLSHFEKRKVSVGTCARAFGTLCVHEHACVRCSLLRPDPAQRARLEEIRDNLEARIIEAKCEGWLGGGRIANQPDRRQGQDRPDRRHASPPNHSYGTRHTRRREYGRAPARPRTLMTPTRLATALRAHAQGLYCSKPPPNCSSRNPGSAEPTSPAGSSPPPRALSTASQWRSSTGHPRSPP